MSRPTARFTKGRFKVGQLMVYLAKIRDFSEKKVKKCYNVRLITILRSLLPGESPMKETTYVAIPSCFHRWCDRFNVEVFVKLKQKDTMD